jgi:hypothetical protein
MVYFELVNDVDLCNTDNGNVAKSILNLNLDIVNRIILLNSLCKDHNIWCVQEYYNNIDYFEDDDCKIPSDMITSGCRIHVDDECFWTEDSLKYEDRAYISCYRINVRCLDKIKSTLVVVENYTVFDFEKNIVDSAIGATTDTKYTYVVRGDGDDKFIYDPIDGVEEFVVEYKRRYPDWAFSIINIGEDGTCFRKSC